MEYDVGYERDITQSHSQETLRRVKENDESLTRLWIGGTVFEMDNGGNRVVAAVHIHGVTYRIQDHGGVFNPSDDSEFSSLGAYIAENTHLKKLAHVDGRVGLDVECLRRNSSIHKLSILCGGRDISEGIINDILQVYQEKKNLTILCIDHANLQNGGVDVLVNTLRGNPNLKGIGLFRCGINDEQMLAIAEAIRGHRMLKSLRLLDNSIGNDGCGALANLFEDPNCNIHTLSLLSNNIGNDGVTTFANSLAINATLQKLDLRNNPIDQKVVEESFCKVFCNKSSIASTHSSNHTLKVLDLPQNMNDDMNEDLLSLLTLNNNTNKSHVAMKKILRYHPIIDMGPMFEWDAEDEPSLKALPYVISWFERAGKAVSAFPGYNIEERKLDAIFQFARAMPLLFVPTSPPNNKAASNKRKRAST